MDVGPYLISAGTKVGSKFRSESADSCARSSGPDALEGDQVAATHASLRYQLLTALAGTLIEARRRFAEQAVLLVHEFTSAFGKPGGYVGTHPRASSTPRHGVRLSLRSARPQHRARWPAHFRFPAVTSSQQRCRSSLARRRSTSATNRAAAGRSKKRLPGKRGKSISRLSRLRELPASTQRRFERRAFMGS